jgi:hypothetical protein
LLAGVDYPAFIKSNKRNNMAKLIESKVVSAGSKSNADGETVAVWPETKLTVEAHVDTWTEQQKDNFIASYLNTVLQHAPSTACRYNHDVFAVDLEIAGGKIVEYDEGDDEKMRSVTIVIDPDKVKGKRGGLTKAQQQKLDSLKTYHEAMYGAEPTEDEIAKMVEIVKK